MGAQCDWNERGCRPAEEVCKRRGEKFSGPSERRSDIGAISPNLRKALRGQRARQEQSEQEQRDAPELAP
jgi:hypothetical protein